MDKDKQRQLNGIGEQMNGSLLLTFHHVPGVEPTNNRAERLPRPAGHCQEGFAMFQERGWRVCDIRFPERDSDG